MTSKEEEVPPKPLPKTRASSVRALSEVAQQYFLIPSQLSLCI